VVADYVDPDAIAHETITLPLADLARYLQRALGQQVVAYVCGLRDPKMVGQWASGRVSPRPPADLRLRQVYEAVRLIAEAYDIATARASLFGTNTRFDNEAPAYLVRYATTFDAMRAIVPTARAFAGDTF
jgi:hypothetical protein